MQALRFIPFVLWPLIEKLAVAVLLILVAIMVITCLGQVITRYVVDYPLTWSEEVARFSFIWLSYLSGWLAWKHRAHIAIELVGYLGKPRLSRASAILSDLLVLGLCLGTIGPSLKLVTVTWRQTSPILGLPMGAVYAGYIGMVVLIAGDILMRYVPAALAKPDPELRS